MSEETSGSGFTTSFTVDATPAQVFRAVTDVRSWWSTSVTGGTSAQGDRFTFEVPGVHRTTQTLTEVIPNERVLWHVSDGWIGFVDDTAEWDGTDIVFEITSRDGLTELRFTHVGLVPAVECYDACSSAWSSYMLGSLHGLIATGVGDPIRV